MWPILLAWLLVVKRRVWAQEDRNKDDVKSIPVRDNQILDLIVMLIPDSLQLRTHSLNAVSKRRYF